MTPIGSRRMTLVAPYAYSIDAWPVSVRAAPAMNRRLSTENGMSPSRACLMVFPWFWTSIGARWSISASIRFASLNSAGAVARRHARPLSLVERGPRRIDGSSRVFDVRLWHGRDFPARRRIDDGVRRLGVGRDPFAVHIVEILRLAHSIAPGGSG